ncbi:MAG: serine/threonine protein kinase [Sandaracinaceae bacterium]|nr:serine/threonine protein kinase [Sandaracinaceae bacterium]
MSTPVPSHPDQSYGAWVGRVIDGRYRIDGLLGEGGMGAVFEAEHLKLVKKVAVKVIHPELAGEGEVAERFVREAMASAQLEHPHVATATDYGTLPEGGGYLVMQFVRGESLRDLIDREGATDWVRACEVAAQVADALSAAHKKGIVHRDLKPDNVMLEPRDDGTSLVKVLDFGVARVASDAAAGRTGPALTRVGTVIGTPGYMAPEQALGESVDFRADLYALGLVLYEMVAGEPVFDGRDLTAIVTKQLTEDIPPLSDKTSVPPELDALVAALTARDRDERPESASVVRETLRGLVLGATLQAVASGEVAIPALGTTELGGASRREATPMRVPLPGPDPKGPPAVRAAAAHAKQTTRRPGLGSASTQLALEAVRERPLPLAIGAGAGCAVLGLFGVVAVAVLALSGGDADPIARKGQGLAAAKPAPPAADPGVTPTPPATPPPSTPILAPTAGAQQPVPDALLQAVANLMNDDRYATRRNAARAIADYEPAADVPEYAREVAALELTSICARKRERVLRLGELGDPRALPALERLDAAPRNGCGNLFRRTDCFQCLRRDLSETLSTLRARM